MASRRYHHLVKAQAVRPRQIVVRPIPTIATSAIAVHHATPLLRVRHTAALHRVLRHIATVHHSAAAHAEVAAIQAVAVTLVVAAVAAAHAAEVREAVSREFKIQD